MNDIDDDSIKGVLGEALLDELKAIREYVEVIPEIKDSVNQIANNTKENAEKLNVIEAVVREHDKEIRTLKQKTA